MMNKFYDTFDPGHIQYVLETLKRITKEQIEQRSCFVCKHVKNISDDRDTYHLCEYTNDFLPKEQTCLLWELNEKEQKYVY